MTYFYYGLRVLFWLALVVATVPAMYHFSTFVLITLTFFTERASVPWKLFVYGMACAALFAAILAVLEKNDAGRPH